jgi:hypothetical protein
MDDEQLTEEQLYYKNKYFKYKLKYVTLKEQKQLGGANKLKETIATAKMLSDEKSKFNPNEIKAYLDFKMKDDKTFLNDRSVKILLTDRSLKNDTLYKTIIDNNIFQAIKDTWAFSVEEAINKVIDNKFKNDKKLKEELKKYLMDLKKSYYFAKNDINAFVSTSYYTFEELSNKNEPSSIGVDMFAYQKYSEYVELRKKMIKGSIISKIQNELKNYTYLSLEKAIDVVLQKEYPNNNDNEALKSFILKLHYQENNHLFS